ncbi:MAG TPA: asparagine synthase (glutamine-hydrolyzing) [Micromonosporaceae bacterium]|nr:asparagine synthase (glutamine-hydrolyzing) [Micromonosporaceae bacterium]
MCGFVVFVDGREAPQLPDLTGPLASLYHRGPDDTVTHQIGNWVSMGFARLAIIDPDGSRQPLSYPGFGTDAGRWTVVLNGEIYNYRELRAELINNHQAAFGTDGDAEVLAAALHHWGPAAVNRLRGMFAFAAWDSHTNTLLCARDPFGIKPLYYLTTPDGLWLASEKKALPVNGVAVDEEALSLYLTYQYVPEPWTLQSGVARLPAGSLLRYSPGGSADIEPYHRPAFRPDSRLGIEPAAAMIRHALRESVHAHMVADVPVGAFLSSGIDSTAVVAFARELNPDLRVFTAGFDLPGYSEIEVAQQTAQHFGLTLTPTVVTAADVMEALPRIIWHLDDPVADPSIVPLYFLAQTAAQHVKVVLSGEGSDELFGGYHIYREPASLAPIRRLPTRIQHGLRAVSTVIPEGVKGKSYLERATTPIEERYYGNARMFTYAEKEQLLRHNENIASHTLATRDAYLEAEGLDDATTMQHIDLRTWLTGDILTKADRMSMAHSLELRVPFLDRNVFSIATRIPTSLRLPANSKVTKHVLRHALRDDIPAFVIDRPKLGFPTPTAHWLRGEIGEWADQIFAESQTGHLIHLTYARELLRAHRNREADHARKIWTLLNFCLWHRIFVDRCPVLSGVRLTASRI